MNRTEEVLNTEDLLNKATEALLRAQNLINKAKYSVNVNQQSYNEAVDYTPMEDYEEYAQSIHNTD